MLDSLERSVDLYFPQQLEEVDGVFREMQVFHGIFLSWPVLFHVFSTLFTSFPIVFGWIPS